MPRGRAPEGEQRTSSQGRHAIAHAARQFGLRSRSAGGGQEPLCAIDVSSRNAMEWSHASSLDR